MGSSESHSVFHLPRTNTPTHTNEEHDLKNNGARSWQLEIVLIPTIPLPFACCRLPWLSRNQPTRIIPVCSYKYQEHSTTISEERSHTRPPHFIAYLRPFTISNRLTIERDRDDEWAGVNRVSTSGANIWATLWYLLSSQFLQLSLRRGNIDFLSLRVPPPWTPCNSAFLFFRGHI